MYSSRFYFHGVQCVSVNEFKDLIRFETHHPNNRSHYFPMTIDEFYGFNDSLSMIERGNMQGDFPLSDQMWFRFELRDDNEYEIKFYRNGSTRRSYFSFYDDNEFHHYRKNIHPQLLLFLRSRDERLWRRRRERLRYRSNEGEVVPTSRKRPHPDESESAYQSTATINTCERSSSSRATNDAFMCDQVETSAIFPKWSNSNPRRQDDPNFDQRSVSNNLSSPEGIHLTDSESISSNSDNMEMY